MAPPSFTYLAAKYSSTTCAGLLAMGFGANHFQLRMNPSDSGTSRQSASPMFHVPYNSRLFTPVSHPDSNKNRSDVGSVELKGLPTNASDTFRNADFGRGNLNETHVQNAVYGLR
jgi:hypothetical protein